MKSRKALAALASVMLLATACTSPDKASTALAAQGYTDIELTGYAMFGCGERDTSRTGFVATGVTGVRVRGVVCSGWLKGSTIRITGTVE